MITPLLDEPALIVENSLKTLVIADIHIGIERELYHSGVNIPSQTQKHVTRILDYINRVKPDKIVLLGDIKHNILPSWQEKHEIPEFLEKLASYASVEIVPGNHDGNLGDIIPTNVRLHSMKGFVLDDVGYFHGHAWPREELFSASTVVMSHNHPIVRLIDPLGYGMSEPVWIRTHFVEKVIRCRYNLSEWKNPEVIIMPAFNQLCGGVVFNEPDEELLGPMLNNNAIELDNAQVYLLDATYLGTLKGIRLNSTRTRGRGRWKISIHNKRMHVKKREHPMSTG